MAELRLLPTEPVTVPEIIEGGVAVLLLGLSVPIAVVNPGLGLLTGLLAATLLVNQAFELGFLRL